MWWIKMGVICWPLLGLSLSFLPDRMANRAPGILKRVVWALAISNLVIAIFCGAFVATMGTSDWECWSLPYGLGLGVYLDPLTVIMSGLVSLIGLVIVGFSMRYLDGDSGQGKFLKWIAFTLSAVMLLVLSRNLLMLTMAWVFCSYGLHQLLMHYPERVWAVWAARKKFLISRLGDLFLLGALVLTWNVFGALDYTSLFAAAEGLARSGVVDSRVLLIGALFALGAMTKSAQLPFHSWLPDTLETPTPVSALMHAGVINAGGFLVIRLSPLVSLSWLALDMLLAVGALTAVAASVVMLTQTNVKRMLAWSTVAQMGFMMLQCGLGAFSAALVHLIAHSLYKAHAFLRSGSAIDAAHPIKQFATKQEGQTSASSPRWILGMSIALGLSIAISGFTIWLFGVDWRMKPGILVLALVQIMALTQLIGTANLANSRKVWGFAMAIAFAVCCGYWSLYLVIDFSLQTVHVGNIHGPSWVASLLGLLLILGLIGLLAMQAFARRTACQRWLRSLYVHATHGFYLDLPVRTVTARVWGQRSPTP
jgi:NAD(P)H-quinone oxidoreductase subunit 5